MTREELAAWLRLTLSPGLGPGAVRRLLAAFGLPQQVLAQPASALRQVLGPAQVQALLDEAPELAELATRSWDWLQAGEAGEEGVGRRILVLGDADYPASLLAIEDPPPMLYLLGQVDRLAMLRGIAVVGSRNPTPQGAANARQFARALASAGLSVVSGLALGVDGAAHEGALEGATPGQLATLAVVGTGLDRVYPRQHLDLARRIARQGLLVSEYPLGTPPLAPNFPRRNRLISGLSQGTLVVEAALKSGSLITARLASEQGREVFAIPGSIHAAQSRGCHALIRQGAKLVESAQDVLEELRWPVPAPETEKPLPATGADDPLLTLMGHDPVSLDALQARSGLDTPTLQTRLLTLELDGAVGRLPGGLFQRLASA
ncbi:DNA-processing protein DprA [Ramlibacter sp. 2FC]|uniref:DNA-processing protein DprA n=1 Tax=Ramlibacter sp. 2FC TaxID=2502188 RepID=UPI0010F62F1E|nr:DNA-processing protein DprA [Ramlibacter sp. 2FC]